MPQTPSFGKRNELFYNNVEKFEVDLRAECSVNTSLGIFLWPCPSSKSITSYFGNRVAPKAGASTDAGSFPLRDFGTIGDGSGTPRRVHDRI